jgi:hypothetical protein
MRSDFINKRDYNRRRATDTQTFVDGEIIVIPEFDTFIEHKPPIFGTQVDRWSKTSVGSATEQSPQIPVALLNPWNDGEDMLPETGSQLGTVYPARTPSRAVMTFNLASLPTTGQILDAKLNLTVASSREW